MSKKTTINKKILEDLVREKLSGAKEADNLNFSTPPESDTEVITSTEAEKQLDISLKELSSHALSLNLIEFNKSLELLAEEGVDLEDALWAMMDFMPVVPDSFRENSIYQLADRLRVENHTKEAEFIENEAASEESPFIEMLRVLISHSDKQKQSLEESLVTILQEAPPAAIPIAIGIWGYRAYKAWKAARRIKKLRKAQKAAEKARKARAKAARAKKRAKNRKKRNLIVSRQI